MKKKLLIIASNYYKGITQNLINDSSRTLNAKKHRIKVIKVPGTFEIPVVISKNIKKFDGFIALGCVIKGETPHFDFICTSTFIALLNLAIKFKKPVGNGIITALNMKQAKKRSYIKGREAATAVLEIIKND
jgi:6,7-dimethyl-8-ribityllumazine synthase|tara:strand:+ start:137 stop:532 length:396 start_codon:yes stop_codon:yes gene_type:complete